MNHFERTRSIDKDGKFIVRLAFKGDTRNICDNKSRALLALYCVEQKLKRYLKNAYIAK